MVLRIGPVRMARVLRPNTSLAIDAAGRPTSTGRLATLKTPTQKLSTSRTAARLRTPLVRIADCPATFIEVSQCDFH